MNRMMSSCLAAALPLGLLATVSLPAGEQTRRAVSAASSICPDEDVKQKDRSPDEEGWEQLTDGKTFDGWKANENEQSWKLEDGAFVAQGERSHLFYVGPEGYEKLEPFKNFELKVDVMTKPGSNGGIYFHTKWQDEGWPANGYECQVNVSQRDPVKTGSLYNTEGQKLYKEDIENIIKDNEYWTQHIIVRGDRVVVKLNDKEVINYKEPADKEGPIKLSEGTFALQAHDPNSVVYFKNIRVKRLPD